MRSDEHQQPYKHEGNPVLDSINVSEIEASKSNPSIADAMEKLSNLSTASFSLSTFKDHGNFEESTTTNDKFSYSELVKSDVAINGTGTTKKFPPLTPQDLMENFVISNVEPVRNTQDEREHSSFEQTLPITDDMHGDCMEDMDLDDLNDDDDQQRQQAKYIDSGGQESSNYSVTNDTARANVKASSGGSTSMGMSVPFRLNYDSLNSLDDNDNENKMSLGDLETVKEEQSKSNYAMFVGLDSDETTTSQNTSLQEAFEGFKSSISSKTSSSIANKKRKRKKKSPKKTQKQMQIEKRLEKLKLREKAKRYSQIARTQI